MPDQCISHSPTGTEFKCVYPTEHTTHVALYVQLMKWMASYKFTGSYLQPAYFKG